MDATRLREIQERHEAAVRGALSVAVRANDPSHGLSQTAQDRAALLAEVDRLKALCGRAALRLAHQNDGDIPGVRAELRAAQ